MIEWVNLALALASKYMEKTPDYSQKKKEKFYDLKSKYENEMAKQRVDRDDSRVDHYSDELFLFLKTFYQEISK